MQRQERRSKKENRCGNQFQEPTQPSASAAIKPVLKPAEELILDDILAKYQDLTYEQLHAELKPRPYLEKLSFDPTPVI